MILSGSERCPGLASRVVAAILPRHWREKKACGKLQLVSLGYSFVLSACVCPRVLYLFVVAVAVICRSSGGLSGSTSSTSSSTTTRH